MKYYTRVFGLEIFAPMLFRKASRVANSLGGKNCTKDLVAIMSDFVFKSITVTNIRKC